jgi:hypothetical protein
MEIPSPIEYLKEMDEKYPDRHKIIHKACCKHCPSKIGMENDCMDDEAKEIAQYPKEVIVREFLFVCAWRPEKLCKGLCDFLEIDQEFIDSIYAEENGRT